ncbi:MAG TPA: hypothetical protein PLV68_17455, partial [Ilumatobacteraceae bacterium]|nr:hypothetical protein [Ilumatobacteraceae bacterium]
MSLVVDFCGERHTVVAGTPFIVGREADLSIDDNPFLHRRFLSLEQINGIWMLRNVGKQLTATAADASGHLEAFLAPGAALPIVLPELVVSFTAGPTTYSFMIQHPAAEFAPALGEPDTDDFGDTTIGATQLTPDQKRLVVALAEPRLAGDGRGTVNLPSS